MRRPLLTAVLTIQSATAVGYAQTLPDLDGFYLNVGQWADASPITPGGLADLQRLRLMTAPRFGDFTFEVAYEHFLGLEENSGASFGSPIAGSVQPTGGEWLNLQWTIEETDHLLWRHRFDRLNLSYRADGLTAALGRQTISWATTLFLTPADPFSPFDPADPFRFYRAGVDAARLKLFLGSFSEADFVVRPTKSPLGEELTALGRVQSLLLGWEVSGWAGMIFDEPGGALAGSGSIGAFALRGELSLRSERDSLFVRGALGTDRLFSLFSRDLYLVVEYQHDDFGASGGDDIARVIQTEPFARGELQVLGRDEIAVQGAYQVHPLWSANAIFQWNLNDGSALLGPQGAYSLSNETSIGGGVFFGLGSDAVDPSGIPLSEYGSVPFFFYLSLTAFFW